MRVPGTRPCAPSDAWAARSGVAGAAIIAAAASKYEPGQKTIRWIVFPANDERVGEFLNRPLTGEWPYVWLDATYLKVRQGGRIVPVAAIVAVAANTEGRREIIGLGIGPSEAETFWTEFLRSLRARGLGGVRLVISDAHTGLKAAIARVFEATWQRCRVHWIRNALAHVSRGQHTVVAAAIRQAFDQPDRAHAGETWRKVSEQLRPQIGRAHV